ncbi:hypothetical protein CRENBAI_026246 [Crenichthys baileyi]|uniref:Uncharacterized protein n=1 Tax=Crenichthys baileyi TaxID=28760 RepID=A0AAV9RL53_9TELE
MSQRELRSFTRRENVLVSQRAPAAIGCCADLETQFDSVTETAERCCWIHRCLLQNIGSSAELHTEPAGAAGSRREDVTH